MSLSQKTIEYLEKNCPCSLAGKTVLITGGNSGIGCKTAETLIRLGASVILVCRNREKAAAARESLLRDEPGAEVRLADLDLADFRSIEAFADALPDVDVFINNAGLFHHPGEKTADGFDLVMGTNYLGVYYLTEMILPKLLSCGHSVTLINTGSIVHKTARVDYSRFQNSRGSYPRSKLCLARYSNALVSRCAGTNVHVFMSHPGVAVTPIAAHLFGSLYRLYRWVPVNSAEKSSLAAAWILSHDIPEGSVVGPNGLFCIRGYPGLNRPCKRAAEGIPELMRYTENEITKARNRRG